MNIQIRIKHYIDGYERIVTLSGYESWRRTEKELGRPVFEVIGIIVDDHYFEVKNKDNMYEEITEYGLQNVDTGSLFPEIYESEYAANKIRSRRIDPDRWIVVKRKVGICEWEEVE